MIQTNDIDWTHKGIKITDVRKLSKLYVVKVEPNTTPDLLGQTVNTSLFVINTPLFVKDTIFEERLKSYFLRDMSKITREDILNVMWNMYITRGYYIKINEKGDVEKFPHDPEKWYVSYLEIEGPLGTFSSIYRDKELNKQ
jgi:hypothetical protein